MHSEMYMSKIARTLLRVTGTVYHREHWQDHSSMLSLTEGLVIGERLHNLNTFTSVKYVKKMDIKRLPIHPVKNWHRGLLPVGQEEVG